MPVSAAAPPLLDPKPVLVAPVAEDAGDFIPPNDGKEPVPGVEVVEGAGFPNAGAADGAPATVVVDAGIAGLPKIPPAVEVVVVDFPPPKPPKDPKLDATSVTGALVGSSSFFANADGGAIFGVSGGAESGADVSTSSFFFVGAAVASDPKLNALFSEFALADARCKGGGEDGIASSFSSSLLSSAFNSSTDPKAFDFGTLVAIEEVPKPRGFTAGAGATDASVTGAEATGGAREEATSLSSFFSFSFSSSFFSSGSSLAMPKLKAGLLSAPLLVDDGAKLNAGFGFSSSSIAFWIFA